MVVCLKLKPPVAGIAVLADICMEMEKTGPTKRKSPKLLSVFYNPYANVNLAHKRLKPLENRIKHVEIVKPVIDIKYVEL